MSGTLHPIDKIFSGALTMHQDEPSENVWETLEARLDKEFVFTRKRRSALSRRAAMALLGLLLWLAVYDTRTNDKPSLVKLAKVNSTIAGAEPVPGKPIEQLVERGSRPLLVNLSALMPYSRSSERKDSAQRPAWAKALTSNIGHLPHPQLSINIASALPSSQTGEKERPKEQGANGTLPPAAESLAKANSFRPYWEVNGFVSPELAHYRLEDVVTANTQGNPAGDLPPDQKRLIEQRERHRFSFVAGASLRFNFSRHIFFSTGAFYSNTIIDIEPQIIYATGRPNGTVAYKYITSSGYGYLQPSSAAGPSIGDSLFTSTAQHRLQYFSVPVSLGYKIFIKKMILSPELGISANFLTSAKLSTEIESMAGTEKADITKLGGTRVFYLGLTASAEISCPLSKKWSANIAPVCRYSVTPVTKENVVRTYPYSFGAQIGVAYKL